MGVAKCWSRADINVDIANGIQVIDIPEIDLDAASGTGS